MARLKISSNLFLEVNELNRFLKFIETDGYKKIFQNLIKNFGIVENESFNSFLVSKVSGSTNSIYVNEGIAYDSSLNCIQNTDSSTQYTVTNTGTPKWIILSYGTTNIEKGKIKVGSDGSLTGYNTEFKSILRGQLNFPVKIKFPKSQINTEEYEVVSVNSDTSAVIVGSLSNEENLDFCVIGTFTPGFIPSESNKTIYEYDSYTIQTIESETSPVLDTNEFFLAKVYYDSSNILVVEDKREDFFNLSSTTNNAIVSVNPLMSLTDIKSLTKSNTIAQFEAIFEFGYKVNTFNSSGNSFQISSGSCNFLQSGDIPDGLFKGWTLYNKTNQNEVIINGNTNKNLTLSNSILSNDDNEFIIIPTCSKITLLINLSSNIQKYNIPFIFECSPKDFNARCNFYCKIPSSSDLTLLSNIVAKFQYKIDESSLNNLATAYYKSLDDSSQLLLESSMVIDLTQM